MRASTTWKSASSRVRPETSVRCTAARFAPQVRAQLADLRAAQLGGGAPDHRRLEHAAHLEHLARLVDAGLGDARAARRLERDQAGRG